MQLKTIKINNFRLLHDIALTLEERTTVIVGRNNSGKTSLSEVMRRLLGDGNPSFQLEDFSFSTHASFWDAFMAWSQKNTNEQDVRKILPIIEIRLIFSYSLTETLGTLSEFIIDLEPDCMETLITARYALRDGKISELFADIPPISTPNNIESMKRELFRALRERVPRLFGTSFTAVDPTDASNEKSVEASTVRALCANNFISAQRGLDDVSQKDRTVIGKVLENLFTTAKTHMADAEGHNTAKELERAVKNIQDKIDTDFNLKLNVLLPALSLFNYPNLPNQKLHTETILDVERLLTNHTKVRYAGTNGVHLPETYSGLGTRNIILILLQLWEFFKLYTSMEPRPGVHVIFIEEPEVHLHPQMQEVFIRQLSKIAEIFSNELGSSWPVQFVVSTHSSHVANEAHFETIRYFLTTQDTADGTMKAIVKDLRKGLSEKPEVDRAFLHQYMTLTRCDLFFADKAILIEGTTERLLLPRIIRMLDEGKPREEKLGSQYLSVVEIGGAYAHIFFDLLTFLDLRTLVITDIDTVGSNCKSCQVSLGVCTSNACIKAWFKTHPDETLTPTELLKMDATAKTIAKRRIAFQLPEKEGGPCGRSLEDAFMLANPKIFKLKEPLNKKSEKQAWEEAKKVKKSEFALKYALSENDNFNIPRYIVEGLTWLAESPAIVTPTVPETTDTLL